MATSLISDRHLKLTLYPHSPNRPPQSVPLEHSCFERQPSDAQAKTTGVVLDSSFSLAPRTQPLSKSHWLSLPSPYSHLKAWPHLPWVSSCRPSHTLPAQDFRATSSFSGARLPRHLQRIGFCSLFLITLPFHHA